MYHKKEGHSMKAGKSLCRRLLCFGTAICMAVALLPVPAAAAADTDSNNAIINNSFESPHISGASNGFRHMKFVEGWSTTATDGQIELASDSTGVNKIPHMTNGTKNIPDGHQFAELNANEESTLYQDTTTVGGHVYEWGLDHRGRTGIDKMALIIGPTQKYAPHKSSSADRDQFMRLTDWVQRNAASLGILIPVEGCSQRITVYSKPFAEDGGFQNNTGNESPFSTAPSNVYTEAWSVWIISTSNGNWGKYGTNSDSYDPEKGVGGGLSYQCSYAVPDGQTQTTFAFCSYSSSGGSRSVGNLIDDLHFTLYHTVTISATTGGQGSAVTEINGSDITTPITDEKGVSILVRNNNTMRLQAVEHLVDGKAKVSFVGAYLTRQTANGAERVFVPASSWTKSSDGSTNNYTYEGHVVNPTDVVLIFVQSPTVTYDANGGSKYCYADGASEPTNIVSFAPTVDSSGTHYRDPYTAHAASGKDGWQFAGWLLARENKILDADHTVSYNADSGEFTFTDKTNGTITLKADGVALIAQWRWRQTVVAQLRDENGAFSDNGDCGKISITGVTDNDIARKSYYADTGERVIATAEANPGYCFLGWYRMVGTQLQLVSQDPDYSYTVGREDVQTVYARFSKTYQVTYQWDPVNCPSKAPALPEQSIVAQGETCTVSQMYTPKNYRVQDTVNGIPGNWVFQGWREETGSDYVGAEIANVNANLTLVGSWDFVPYDQHRLTYIAGNSDECWIPSGLEEVSEENPLHYYNASVTALDAPVIPGTNQNLLAVDKDTTFIGTWKFQGWKRMDNNEVIQAGDDFTMPDEDLTLTGQWSFTPNTYTVQYDLNGGSGTAPAGHTEYAYPEIAGKTGVQQADGIPFGAQLTLQAFTGTAPEGKYFAGWGLRPDGTDLYQPGQHVTDKSLQVSKNGDTITLYAIYKDVDTITVEFSGNNADWGTVTNRSGSFTKAENTISGSADSTAAPYTGYHFVQWTCLDDDDFTSRSDTLNVTSSDIQMLLQKHPDKEVFQFQAQFEPNAFTVHFDANVSEGGVSGTMANQHFQYADASQADESAYLSPNQFTRSGYRFVGWAEYAADDEIPAGYQGEAYADQAKFRGVTTYQYEEQDGSYQRKPIQDGDTITLYARWEKLADITIDYTPYPENLGTVTLNSETANLPDTSADDNDTLLSVTSRYTVKETGNPENHTFLGATAAPNAGSNFLGWFNQQNELVFKELRFVPQREHDGMYHSASYVAWFQAKQYQLTYDANGGTGEMAEQTFTHGADQSIRKCGFTRNGYDFLGWAASADGSAVYHDQQTISITENTTLYAVWKEKNITLLYQSEDPNAGAVTAASESVAAVHGQAKGSTAQAKSGYQFDGWYDSLGNKLSDTAVFVPEKAKDGVWQEAVYTARFTKISSGGHNNGGSHTSKPSDDKTDEKPNSGKNPPEMLNSTDHVAYIVGFSDGTIRPNASITRAEVATIFFRMLKDDVRNANLTNQSPYPDVPTDMWYSNAVSTLSAMGIITGYPDGTFRPNSDISRAEFSAIAARFDETAQATGVPFTDLQGCWATEEIAQAYANGWVNGYPDGTFRPQENITRAAAITIINRALQRLPENEADLLADQQVWPDNPRGFWAYLAIQEATNSHLYNRKSNGYETQTQAIPNRNWVQEFEQ